MNDERLSGDASSQLSRGECKVCIWWVKTSDHVGGYGVCMNSKSKKFGENRMSGWTGCHDFSKE